MKQFNFKWILGIIYLGMVVFFFSNQGEENLVFNLQVYLIAPIVALIAGLLSICCLGWSGKKVTVLKCVLVALGLWFLGEITILYYTQKGQDPYPSIADLFFIIGDVFFIISVWFEAKLFGLNWKQMNLRGVFILSTVFLIMVGLLSYITVVGYRTGESLLANITTISWSVGDLLVGVVAIILLAMVWKFQNGTVKKAWLWFIAAVVVNFTADIIYGWDPELITDGSFWGTVLNIMWVGGYFLFAGYFLEVRNTMQRLHTKINIKNVEEELITEPER